MKTLCTFNTPGDFERMARKINKKNDDLKRQSRQSFILTNQSPWTRAKDLFILTRNDIVYTLDATIQQKGVSSEMSEVLGKEIAYYTKKPCIPTFVTFDDSAAFVEMLRDDTNEDVEDIAAYQVNSDELFISSQDSGVLVLLFDKFHLLSHIALLLAILDANHNAEFDL